MLFVLASQKIGNRRPEEALHGTNLRRHHSDLHRSRAKRGCGFQPDETGTHHYRMTCAARGFLDALAVSQASQRKHRRPIRARHVQWYRLRSGGQQQRCERQRVAVAKFDQAGSQIELCHWRVEQNGDS